MRKLVCTVILSFIFQSVFSQNTGSWNVIDLRKKINDKVSFQLESQLRSLHFYNQFHYHEFSFTTQYKKNENLSFSGMLGKHNTYSEGGNFKSPLVTDEIRLSIYASTTQKFNKIVLENRYRVEERYFLNSKLTETRARFRFGLSTPISPTIKISANNEVFLAIGNKSQTFEKNRLIIGISKKFNDMFETQISYLNQKDNKVNADESGSKFFQIIQIINF